MAPGSPGTKSQEFPGVSQECPGATSMTPRGGGPQRAAEAYVWGNLSEWRREAVTSPLELAGKSLTQIENRKLGWVLGASTDVRAWVMSCLASISVSRPSPGPAADGTRVGDESHLEARAGL